MGLIHGGGGSPDLGSSSQRSASETQKTRAQRPAVGAEEMR